MDSHRLYLLVNPCGPKLWKWNYAYDGKQKTMAFGSYPVVSLADARTKRDENRAILLEGKDPAIQKKLRIEANLEKARNTFELVARDWLKTVKSQWARIHAGDVLPSFERDVFPAIGDLPIAELTPPKVIQILRSVEERGAIESAQRLRQRISTVFVYAIAKGIAERDPTEKLAAVLKPPAQGTSAGHHRSQSAQEDGIC